MLSTRFSFPWVRIHELALPKAFWERPERSKLHRSFLKINGFTSTAMDLTRWTAGWQNDRLFGGVFSTRLLRNPNYMWRIQKLQPVHEHRFTTGVPSKVKLIHCRAWKQPFPKWRMVEATTNMLFHPGGDYICASFARNVFSKQDDEWWICVNDSKPCCGTWRMESWFSYCKCLKQRWPVTALSWKQKDIQRLQTSNRYTITKQGVYQTSSRYHNIRYHFSDKGTYISVHEAIFWNDQG